MANTKIPRCRAIKQGALALLIIIACMLGGCLSGIEEDMQEAMTKYVEEHKEEFVLIGNLGTYFGYCEVPDSNHVLFDKTTSPLYSYLVEMTGSEQPVFIITTTVMHLHYPANLKQITSEERVLISVSENGYSPYVDKPGSLRSSLTVLERDNKNNTGVLYAQCRFLLQIYGYPAGTNSEIGNFVWLFCRCTWDAENQTWNISNIKKLSDGEMILEHY
ncbi:MAG: hypothetical protein PVG93_01625 [Phycisphaerales bacterium]|jgi:hypothetical protein